MSDLAAVRLLQSGDRSAIAVLYHAHAESAIRTAYLITRNKAAAEDAVQQAFVEVIRTAPALRDAASIRPWFYRIVVNAAKRLARNNPRVIPLDVSHDREDPSALLPDEWAISAEEVRVLRMAIAELPDLHRDVVILRYYTGLSEEEIAGVLSIPKGTVKSRLYRAREAILERLEGRGAEGGRRA